MIGLVFPRVKRELWASFVKMSVVAQLSDSRAVRDCEFVSKITTIRDSARRMVPRPPIRTHLDLRQFAVHRAGGLNNPPQIDNLPGSACFSYALACASRRFAAPRRWRKLKHAPPQCLRAHHMGAGLGYDRTMSTEPRPARRRNGTAQPYTILS
jgi:hypothetical protein